MSSHHSFETFIETILFKSRWLLTPMYVGLVLALFLLVIKFIQKFFALLLTTLSVSGNELMLNVLSLVDIVLVANLLLMIIFSGYENFVSKIDAVEGHVDKPEWMGKVGYSDLKLKVIGSVVAISSIELLRAFMTVHSLEEKDLFWMVVVHLTFVVSGVLFALMEKLSHKDHGDDDEDEHKSLEHK
jgi:uncharacterized protein (TIGR00645 family)